MGVVVIGRNEGGRLLRCLASTSGQAARVVYVDSGSSDGSPEAARATGATVVELDLKQPFTAARARNAGFAALTASGGCAFVQFIDGDCELQPGWLAAGREFLAANPRVAVVFGRLRERFPEASVYNRLCDREWQGPSGQSRSSGGIAMMRCTAFAEASGFNPVLIAGEEPELCVRLRAAGWEVWRLDAEMALHDAAMTRFSQWWRRARRAGHAFAEGVALHGGYPERHCVRQVRSALAWGLALPATALAGSLLTPWVLALLAAYPTQVLRLALRNEPDRRDTWEHAFFLVLAKFPEALGVLEYHARHLIRRPRGLIEYK